MSKFPFNGPTTAITLTIYNRFALCRKQHKSFDWYM